MRARSSSRPPSVGERAILEWIAAHALPADSPYREQIKNVRVVGQCGCGCPTIDLAVSESRADQSEGLEIVAEAGAVSPEGYRVALMLFASKGELVCLEFLSSDASVFTLPAANTLHSE